MSISKVLGYIKKADLEFNIIEDGDQIAVGLSGGKDSIVLLYALYLYKKFSKKNYNLIAITIDAGFKGMDFTNIENYCKQLEIPFYLVPSNPNIYAVLLKHLKNDKLQCSICSKMKKAAIMLAAKQFNCNKVAYGHHGDDAIETFFLNAIYGGRLATFKPKMYLSNSKIYLIRPMIYLFEKDIVKAQKEVDLPLVPSTCSNDHHTEREEIKTLLKQLYKKYPKAHDNFLLMLNNKEHQELW